MRSVGNLALILSLTAALATAVGSCSDASKAPQPQTITLNDPEVKNLVRRSYQYVAMYNVNNKFALSQGGWNTVVADTSFKDHTMREIARPNNDSYYIGCMLDLRKDPVILLLPAFDSKYVSLMATGYDHYVNVPLSTRLGDFRKPEKVLFYTSRTEGYSGEPVEGIDRIYVMTGDFVSAVLRVTPHTAEPGRYRRVITQMLSVKLVTLSEYRGGKAKPINDITFPKVGKTDADVFENNLLEVMQFVFNHQTFDANNEIDQGVLAAYKPLGIEPGKQYEPSAVESIDGRQFRRVAELVAAENLGMMARPQDAAKVKPYWMQPKGKATLDALVAASVIGPIGLPAAEAEYPAVTTADGKPLNAMNDYVIRMTKDGLPPSKAFWSLTLYDLQNGFFIPNDRKKYSVGENGGMKLNKEGGIEIYVAAKRPDGVPAENWLPINRKDEDLSLNLRIYVPDAEKMKPWTPPKAEKVK